MFANQIYQLSNQCLILVLLLSAPPILVSMVLGLMVAIFQAATQIQEQTVSFVPKLVAMILVLSLTLPWLIQQMVQYSHDLITNIPNTL